MTAAPALSIAEERLAANDFDAALELLTTSSAVFGDDPRAEFRGLCDEAWARMSIGRVDDAVARLERARALAESPAFDDIDRADVLYRLGCCRVKLGAVANAVQLFSVALGLCERAERTSDELLIDILRWRTRCYCRQRDWDAAHADAEAALELAERLGDERRLADVYFQASHVAERTGQLLVARFYLERAIDLYTAAGEALDAGKCLNNLGGILFLLGDADGAQERLKQSFAIALDLNDSVDAGYAVSSTAQVLLGGGDFHGAEEKARSALELLGGRTDHTSEIGNAHLVLGRALMEQGRLDEADDALRTAEANFELLGSLGHEAAAWLARGDLAARRGLVGDAAAVYRRAAEALQDVRF
jgi:tetratricopeptide (TPR) repeat protein